MGRLAIDTLIEAAILAWALGAFRVGRRDVGFAVLALAIMEILNDISEDSKTVEQPIYGNAYIVACVIGGLVALLLVTIGFLAHRAMQRQAN